MRKATETVLSVLFVVFFVISVLPSIVLTTKAAPTDWTLVTDARATKAYTDLKEYVWQKTPNALPNGQYDKIGLHRLTKTDSATKGVIFIIPNFACGGAEYTSNPSTDNWTKIENYTQAIYWANRGFDVYAMDLRTHFVPTSLNLSQLSFMKDWGWDTYVSDAKEAINKAKAVSGAQKIFLVSYSQGTRIAMNYAAKYWKEDLKGIILESPVPYENIGVLGKRGNETNTYNYTEQINSMISSGGWALENAPLANIQMMKYALENPGASAEYPPGTPLTPTTNPATNKSWANITERNIYFWSKVNPVSNALGGYGNITQLEYTYSVMDRWVPSRVYIEASAMTDWVNCPYVTYDYDDHYKEIDVPVLVFSGLAYSNRTGTFRGLINGLGTSDFTTNLLPNYGLYDLFLGTYSARDVNQPALEWMISHSTAGWTLTTDSRSLKAYPDLRETIWQKTAAMPPNSQYDKIGLHRLAKTGTTTKGTVFFVGCPMWGMGEQRISNPTTDNWTKTEAYSAPIYYANRGYDVYAIDFRPNFVPKTLNGSQMSAIAEKWGWDVWVSDIKEAAEKIKEVSGSQKFFITGECTGGFGALNYATKYWQEDLRGIILVDANYAGAVGYPIVSGSLDRVTNSFNLPVAIASMTANATGAYDSYRAVRPIIAYALQNPGAPAQYPPGTPLTPAINPVSNKTWTNITEWFSYGVQSSFGSATIPIGSISNLLGGYGNVSQVEYCFTSNTFLPFRLILENLAMADWNNCPYLTYDYNDHYGEIGVPLLAYAGPYTNQTGNLRFVAGIDNSDFTATYMPKYGHLDFFFGTNSAKDISQPIVNWMSSHYQPPAASTFSSVTIFAGQTWYFYVNSNGGVGQHKYQWYEGNTAIAGQTDMVLRASKPSAGTYTYYCKVTDAEGTTTNSSPVTLTVK